MIDAKTLLECATPGPWDVWIEPDLTIHVVVSATRVPVAVISGLEPGNARFIAAAPDLAKRMIELEEQNAILTTEKHADAEAIAGLRAEVERLRGALEFYTDRGFEGYDVTITDCGIRTGLIIKDAGALAREALATPEQEGKRNG